MKPVCAFGFRWVKVVRHNDPGRSCGKRQSASEGIGSSGANGLTGDISPARLSRQAVWSRLPQYCPTILVAVETEAPLSSHESENGAQVGQIICRLRWFELARHGVHWNPSSSQRQAR